VSGAGVKRAACGLALAATALALGGAPAAAGGEGRTAARQRPPSRLLVTASEWQLVLSRPKLGKGPAIVQLHNDGEDPHNLRIRRVDGGRTRAIDTLEPGEVGQLELWLRRGRRYRLWCSLPRHRERGMRATLKVAKKRRYGR
jgi:hypothetical protein